MWLALPFFVLVILSFMFFCVLCLAPSQDVVNGNSKLNLAFVANLFNMHPALEPSDEGLPDFDLGDFDETREEKSKRQQICIDYYQSLYLGCGIDWN